MSIRVKGYVTFRTLVGERKFELQEGQKLSLQELLASLGAEIGPEFQEKVFDPTTGEVRAHVSVLVNGKQCTHPADRMGTELKDGDEVAIFPPMAGGGSLREGGSGVSPQSLVMMNSGRISKLL